MSEALTFLTDDKLLILIDSQTGKPKESNTIIIDVRAPDEYAKEHIADSHNIPLDALTFDRLAAYRNATIIFHCKLGHRTKQAANLLASIPCQQAYCLTGGIEQWKQANLPTQTNPKAPIEIMRQVQFIVGLMILIGLGLSLLISPYFLLLPLAAGLGLLAASFTGSCILAKALMWLPYNRPK